MFYIYHHLGLGDHIICNGMVRHFLEEHGKIGLFCHSHYQKNVNYLYRDDSEINILPYKNESDICSFLSSLDKNKYKKIGFNDLNKYSPNGPVTVDEAFYELAGVDFENRFSKFYLKRDFNKEKEALKELNPKNEKFIYVHDDSNRGFAIHNEKHRQDLKIIKNDFRFTLFDMMGIIEEAEEVHTMQTGLFDLINSFKLEKPKIFVHTYVRKYPPFILTKGLNDIMIVE